MPIDALTALALTPIPPAHTSHPLLRHVYFQVSCMRDGPLAPSIGVGLSTPEMPLSTLVGAFSNSVGICSTGQVSFSCCAFLVGARLCVCHLVLFFFVFDSRERQCQQSSA